MKTILLFLVLSVCPATAQEVHRLEGEVHSETPMDFSWLTAKVELLGAREASEAASVSVGGEFSFRGIPDGVYTLRLVDQQGNEVTSQPLTVMGSNPLIEVRLPEKKTDRPTGETTSLVRLRHRPSARALKAARAAQKFSEAGNYQRAAGEYEKAVAEDPEYSEAIGNLGAQYVRLNRLAEALSLFRKAISLDPATAQHQSNMALVLVKMGQRQEAERWARHAVEIDAGNGLGHYVLGCILTYQAATLPEAIQQLRTAARTVPVAHEVLSKIYRATGKAGQADLELREYQEAQTSGSAPATRFTSPLR